MTSYSRVCVSIAQVFIVEASGRKLLLLIGFGICCVACVILTVALSLQVQPKHQPHSITLKIISGGLRDVINMISGVQ